MMARSMFGTQRREWWRIHATFVILDVATGDPRWADWSASRIAEALDAGRGVLNPLIYAEVSVGYRSAEELDRLVTTPSQGRRTPGDGGACSAEVVSSTSPASAGMSAG